MSSDAVRRTIRTFVIAFLGIALPGLFGFMNDVTAWANDKGQAAFPDAHNLSYLGISALSAGMIALLNLAVTFTEDKAGAAVLRDVPPKPPAPQA